MSARLALAGVACARGSRTLFEGLSLTLEAGEAAVVIGPNGVGKSSLIRIAAGLLAPTAGTVTHHGARALMAEASALDGEQRLVDALRFWAGLDGARDAVARTLDTVGLTELAEAPVRWLSTGQRKRAALARIMASGAPIWLLDEPANGLDAGGTELLGALIAEHRARGGIALVATHVPIDVPHASTLAL